MDVRVRSSAIQARVWLRWLGSIRSVPYSHCVAFRLLLLPLRGMCGCCLTRSLSTRTVSTPWREHTAGGFLLIRGRGTCSKDGMWRIGLPHPQGESCGGLKSGQIWHSMLEAKGDLTAAEPLVREGRGAGVWWYFTALVSSLRGSSQQP